MRIKDIIYRLLAFMSLLIVLVFILISFRDLLKASLELYPREYREAANLMIAKSFYEGTNPYKINGGVPICVNVYGFVNPMIAAVLSRLFNIGLLRSFYLLSLIYTLIIPILIIYEVYSIVGLTRRTWIYYPFLFFSAYTVTYGTGHISTRPDCLGIIISIIILMILRRNGTVRNVLIAALLLILLFYVKPYFLFFVIPVSIFLLMKDKRSFILLLIAVSFVGVTSFVLIRCIFPLYYVDTIYFEFIEQFLSDGGITTSEKSAELIAYSINQFKELINTYFIQFTIVAIALLGVYTKVRPCDNNRWFSDTFDKIGIYLWNIVLAVPILLLLGRNKGAWISYHMQLLMPAIIIVGFVGIISFSERKSFLGILLLILLVISTPTIYKKYGCVEILSYEEEESWKKIEELCIIASDEGKQIYASCLVNGVLIDRIEHYYTYKTGHAYYKFKSLKIKEFVEKNKWLNNFLFPTILDSMEYMNKIISEDIKKLKDNKYDIIISDTASSVEPGNIEEYDIMYLDLHSGVQNWETTVYIKKQQ